MIGSEPLLELRRLDSGWSDLQVWLPVERPFKTVAQGKKDISVLFEPTDNTSLASFTSTKDHLLLTVLNDVRTEIQVYTQIDFLDRSQIAGLPAMGRLCSRQHYSSDFWLTMRDFEHPIPVHGYNALQ